VGETTHSLEIERQALIDLERNGMVPSTIIYDRYRLIETLDIRRQFLLSERSRILRRVGGLTEPLKRNQLFSDRNLGEANGRPSQ
jgi:hypothetical protein